MGKYRMILAHRWEELIFESSDDIPFFVAAFFRYNRFLVMCLLLLGCGSDAPNYGALWET